MGPRAVRITAEDFLIPAEFGELRLAQHSTGQIGGVHLTLVEQHGRTGFGSTYQQVPLRVLPPFQFPGELASLVYLLNPTAGLLDGDGHLVEIDAGPGSCAVVTGQSSTRIHPAVRGFATQQWRVTAAADSQLVLLPGPNIPFRGCRYYQQAGIDLDPGSRLIWGDIWTPGRYARVGQEAEFYQFARIVQDLEVRRDGVLVFRDHFTWDGPWDEQKALWHVGCGQAAGSGSLFVTGSVENAGADLAGPLRRVVLPLAHGDTLIRWCGPVPELTLDLVGTALRLAASWSGDPHAGPWLIGSNHLAPSHWFSIRNEPMPIRDS